MNYPTELGKKIGIFLFLLLFFLSCLLTPQANAEGTMINIQKQEKIDTTRLTFYFASSPEFEVEHNGQRVDLLLKDVWVSKDLLHLPEDETVVKILLAQKHRDLLTSILLRRVPQQMVAESKQNPPRIVIDLYWKSEQGARPGVAFRMADMPVRKASKKAKEFQQQTPWDGHWREFFRDYRNDWKLKLTLSYTLLPLPLLVLDQASPLWPLQQFATEGKWLSLIRRAGKIGNLDEENTYLKNLLVTEAQIRSGAIETGLSRLDTLRDQQGPEQVRVEYLTAYAQAASGQPFVAQLTIQELLQHLRKGEPLTPICYLLAAETAIDSNQPEAALEFLQNKQLNWPPVLLPVVDLRTADALAGLGQKEKALGKYRTLQEEPGLFEHCLFSLNRAAFTAYQLENFGFAYRSYLRLSELMKQQSGADLVQFAAGASAYADDDIDLGLIGLQKASLDWPGLEGGERAELRLIDHSLLSGSEFELSKAATSYGQLGRQASTRLVREEASFKRALTLFLLKDCQESIAELMRFRREFSSSPLRREADFLLLKQLPIVIDVLLQQHNYLEAVVLVEKNRKLLLSGDLDRTFLRNLANAFDNLGLYDRAARVLLYMFDKAKSDRQREPLYLPLAQSYLKRDEFGHASDYASRYLKEYPAGEDRGALFGVLLDAFAKQGRNEELLAWLGRKDRPSSPKLGIRAAWIYWNLNRPQEIVNCLEEVQRSGTELAVKEMALLAESYYRLNKNSAAEKIYRQLVDDSQYGSQAHYRLAQVLLRQQQPERALNLLARLVDEDGGTSWGKLAQDLLFQQQR
ncbi:lipopolysaccharide assembly protein LapB [Malonomonas rubra]|uniref:tetratricopeptide repeat protein n=1 Tax=Malonomonas rubra TaxID=57040 RepID=UPI0026EF83F0|nr:tetratricopeptide repeat protein [Malonomonas rubra]